MSKETVRIGVPFRSLEDEQAGAEKAHKIEFYYAALRRAGAEPVPISLHLPPKRLHEFCLTLDGIVLPGSGNDVDPARYGEKPHPKTAPTDIARENTDFALLDDALAEGKPVLAICYGNQLLNVYRGGSLVQDIPSEPGHHIAHTAENGRDYPEHPVEFVAGSPLVKLAGATTVTVNSSHHQAIRKPGRNLRVTAHAPDGIIEAVEWAGDSHWVVGVQWHPERMEDAFSANLFDRLVAVARHTPVKTRS